MYEPEELLRKFWWLTAPQAAIRRNLKLTDKVSIKKLRYGETWHTMPLAKNWVATIGSWGGICTIEEIQKIAGVDYEALKKFRERHNLQTARTSSSRVPAWKVALTAMKDFHHFFKMEEVDRIIHVAGIAGILPFELMIYAHEIEALRKRFRIQDVLELMNDSRRDIVEAAWSGSGGVADAIDMATTGIYTESSR